MSWKMPGIGKTNESVDYFKTESWHKGCEKLTSIVQKQKMIVVNSFEWLDLQTVLLNEQEIPNRTKIYITSSYFLMYLIKSVKFYSLSSSFLSKLCHGLHW